MNKALLKEVNKNDIKIQGGIILATIIRLRNEVKLHTTEQITNNVKKAVRILKKKNYRASCYNLAEDLKENKIIIWFTVSINQVVFPSLPLKFESEDWSTSFLLRYEERQIKDIHHKSAALSEASNILLRWANKLETGVHFNFEINIPSTRTRDQFIQDIKDELHISSYHSGVDPLYYYLIVDPKADFNLRQSINDFAKAKITIVKFFE